MLPFERVEVIVDFSEVPVGSQVILRNELEVGRTGQIMLLDDVRQEADPSSVPSALRALERLEEGYQPRRRGTTRWAWT
jgi:spore coat protein A